MSDVTFSPALGAALDACTTQLEWASTLRSFLGATPRMRCYHNGVEFLNVGIGGAFTAAPRRTPFGRASDVTARIAVNLGSGSAVLRVEGGGHWAQGSLGLPGAGRDFTISGNPTATSGFAVNAAAFTPPSHLPPGVEQVGVPYSVTKQDWSTGVAGAEETIYFDEDGGDIVWDDAERAADTGPIPYRRSTQTFVHGTGGNALELGIHMAILPPSCNDEVNAPVYEIGIAMKPYNRWAQYPAMATYNAATDSTFLEPCKFIIKDQAGNALGTIQMHDGLPISSPLLGQTRNATTAFRPLVHTKQMLYWVSHRLALSKNARKYNNGMVPGSSNRPGQARQMASSNGVLPCFGTGESQYNGYLQWHFMPPWPLTTMAGPAEDPVTDPQAPNGLQYDPSGNNTDGARNGARAVGFMHEPGAVAGHDWYPSPGGNRFDRYFISSPMAAYLTDPDGVRPQGNVPYKLLCHEYGKGFFNHGHHDVTNPRTFATIPHEQVGYGQWAYTYGYYTPQGPIFVAGGESRHIDTKTLRYGWRELDKDGRHHYHGWQVDALHAYAHPGWYALMFNSVMLMISAKLRYNAIMMSMGPSGSPFHPPAGDDGFLMQRMHAWRYLNQGLMWKLATSHEVGLSRAQVDARWTVELEYFHDVVVVPATDPAHAEYGSLYFTCLRNFGIPGKRAVSGTNHYIAAIDDAKLLYMAGVLATMKTTGSWDYYRAKSDKCRKAIDLVTEAVRKYSVDRMLATRGRNAGAEGQLGQQVPLDTPLVPLAGWNEWAAVFAPVDGLADLVTVANGDPYYKERYQYQHIWVQAIFMFRDFFPAQNFPGVAEACALTQEMEDRYANWVANGVTGVNGQVFAHWEDFTYRHPAAGILAAPET